jgi:two-component system OmpR family sensor kinase
MTRSLQSRLTVMLCGAVTLAALLTVGTSFVLAYLEAKEFQDDVLRQIASLVRTPASSTNAQQVQRSDQQKNQPDKLVEDPESRITVLRIPQQVAPAWLPHQLSPGLHTLAAPGGDVRVFVSSSTRLPAASTIVMQHTATRDEIAVNSALRTLIPLLLLIPVLAWLVLWIVRAELAPIKKLATTLDLQRAVEPVALADTNLPREIQPFVQAINRLFERLTLQIAQQRRFIADAAHELRSPLTAISLQVNNVSNAESLATIKERVIPLVEGIARTRRLTEQLLDLANAQAESSAEIMLDLSVVLRDCVAEWLPLALSRDVDLGLMCDGAPTVSGALRLLHRVINNGLDNALKYSPAGSRVTVMCYVDGDMAVIDIIDGGPGIAATEREHVFAPFYRLSENVAHGSGLGLAIAQESALRLGGEVSLHDDPTGSGLIFRYRQAKIDHGESHDRHLV